MNNSTAYFNTPSEQIFASTNNDYNAITDFPTWSSSPSSSTTTTTPFSQSQQMNFMEDLGSNELDMSTLVDQSMWPLEPAINQPIQQQQPIIDPLDNLFASWNSNGVQVPPTIKEEWPLLNNNNVLQEEPLSYLPMSTSQSQSAINSVLPLSPPVNSPNNSNNFIAMPTKQSINFNNYNPVYSSNFPQYSREITPPSSASASRSNSPNSSVSTPPPMPYFLPQQQPQYQMMSHSNIHENIINHNNSNITTNTNTQKARGPGRRRSADGQSLPTRTYRRRASSHPSVASVVSLSAHEPVAFIIDGIEYITFLYSHDRLVKEYTVRTNVDSVNLDEIPAGFRVQNAIYPRANVSREEYDGNRWEYETSCNKLGWELCWLNQEQLCGRRGLIQRAVDSYRNRHAEMRSRRVTRQEKVANGTLRKRRAKKAASALL
ncbi:hypothetical protein INT46_001777 [Mucor plumbeus]|uniref:DUF8032 domain-containing protein n=1 Tax=Mucor plumbeus TaxID=97098 RepID=A0A8H7RBB5_9FUNG|nr:hypothetical protein INT46_001777 [Mucor plumbeus]